MKEFPKAVLAGIASLTMLVATSTAQAAFPEKPVTLIVPGPAGSGTDAIGRLIGDEFSRAWGQPVVVENRAGASGMIGTQQLLRVEPDGYTILIGHISTHSVVPAVRTPPPYHPIVDFEAIGRIGSSSNILVVAGDSGIKSLDDLVAEGKNGKTISYGSPGVGLTQHFAGYTFGKAMGTDMLHVPYKGSGPALNDLIGGRLTMMFVTPPAAHGGVAAGKLRALAQTSDVRQKAFPDVPTFEELNMPKLTSLSWWGLFAPAGTPEEVVKAIHASLEQALRKETVRQHLEAMVIEPSGPISPEDFEAFVAKDYESWKAVVEESGIRIQG